MEKDILALLAGEMNGYSKGQKRIARYILENYDKAAFMTASRLGKTVGVSESTVVRFASELGYDGYPAMRRAVEEMIRSRLTSVQRIQNARETLTQDNVLENVMMADIANLQTTLERCDRAQFDRAVDTILAAKHIYIVGMRSSFSLANFLGYYLNLLQENVHIVQDTSACELYEQLLRIREGDVFIGISFPRYSRRTAQAMQYAKSAGARCIGITDGPASPFAGLADTLICARSEMESFLDSLVAPMSLINALIVCVSVKSSENVADIFQKLETFWADHDVYEPPER